jgi:hypothetical protein
MKDKRFWNMTFVCMRPIVSNVYFLLKSSNISNIFDKSKLDKNLIGKMIRENLSFFDIKFQLNTYANGTQYVKMYSDYTAKIGLSAKLKLNYKFVK